MSNSLLVKALLIATAVISFGTPAHSQTGAANFGNVNLCSTNQAGSSSCTKSLPFVLSVPVGPAQIRVVTEGAPDLDFSALSPQCTGTKPVLCTLGVKFSPRYAGLRRGAIQIVNTDSGSVMATQYIYGVGVGPQIGFGLSATQPFGSSNYQGNALAVDASGNVYLGGENVIKIAPSSSRTTLASGLSTTGLAVDGAGNLLVGDGLNRQVLSISPSGKATTLTNTFLPGALAVDGAGNIYVINEDVPEILLLKSGGGSSVVSKYTMNSGLGLDSQGSVITNTNYNLVKLSSNFSSSTILFPGYYADPGAIGVDAAENVFGIERGEHELTAISPGGTSMSLPASTTLADSVAAVTLDDSGNLFYLANNGVITKTQRSTAPTLTFTAGNGTPQTITVENSGNALMTFSSISMPAEFDLALANYQQEACAAGVTLQPGQSCAVSISLRGNPDAGDQAVSLMYTGSNGTFTKSVPLHTIQRAVNFSLTGTWFTGYLAGYTSAAGSDWTYDTTPVTVTVTAPASFTPTPSGTVTFQSNGNVVPNCSAVSLSGGTASCTFYSGAAFTVSAVYNGDSQYRSIAIAGPQVLVFKKTGSGGGGPRRG